MEGRMLLKVTSLFVPARQWLVRRKFRGRDDFQGEIVAPSCEFTSIRARPLPQGHVMLPLSTLLGL